MKISFHIHYPTRWGQTIHLSGSIPALGNWDTEQAINLQYSHSNIWTIDMEVPDHTEYLEYRYFLKSNGQTFFEPWNKKHQVHLRSDHQRYFLHDTWMEKPEQLAFYSSAFTQVLFQRNKEALPKRQKQRTENIRIKVFAPNVSKDQHLAICGNQTIWGNWDTEKALKMSCHNFPEWEVEFSSSDLSYPVEYKFIVYSNHDNSVLWEEGYNRILNLPLLKEKEMAVLSGLTFRSQLSRWKGTGLVIPIFSLRSNSSFGIGDFYDLRKIVDWVKVSGQRVIQILPVNDTTMSHTWTDSYPYNAISIYALHPLYLNPDQMGKLKDKKLSLLFKAKQKELNALQQVDYELVDRYKWMFFEKIFEQDGEETLQSNDFKEFFEANRSWIVPYAAYSYLREKHRTSDFRLWGEYSQYDKDRIASLCQPDNPEYNLISIYYFLQYHAHLQLKAAKDYAHKQGIILKGDIPIGISETSIEAWTEPQYFNMEVSAGAPPDDFSADGQNWGFPTYNWDRMELDSFNWWKKRFQHMAHYFDAYRIDHILGFFRIWEIPKTSVQGLYATFNPALPLSLEEIENTGFSFDERQHTLPRISGNYLSELFGVYAQEASEQYLARISERYFTLRPELDTQQKIKLFFEGKDDFKSTAIRKALFLLANEVLFIPDRIKDNYYHPRIAAGRTFAYRELSQQDRHAFDYMYWDYFYHRQDSLWKEQAVKRLTPLISCTDMLVCGEDLGMIPACVPEVMEQLQILSLEIERMPKQPNMEFGALDKIPYNSVCTTSTHDMPTLRGWWEEDREKTQRYYKQVLKMEGEAPSSCTPDICRRIIENHLASPAMLVLIPFQDWASIDEKVRLPEHRSEQINIPANPRHYWQYRMHLTIENLLKEKGWNSVIQKIIEDSGRT